MRSTETAQLWKYPQKVPMATSWLFRKTQDSYRHPAWPEWQHLLPRIRGGCKMWQHEGLKIHLGRLGICTWSLSWVHVGIREESKDTSPSKGDTIFLVSVHHPRISVDSPTTMDQHLQTVSEFQPYHQRGSLWRLASRPYLHRGWICKDIHTILLWTINWLSWLLDLWK